MVDSYESHLNATETDWNCANSVQDELSVQLNSEHTKLRLIKCSTQHKTRSQCGQEMSHEIKTTAESARQAGTLQQINMKHTQWRPRDAATELKLKNFIYKDCCLGSVKTCLL